MADGTFVSFAHSIPLEPRLDLRRHSPSGFEWGYEGSGPAQLALALLAHATRDDQLALKNYQQFKRECIATIASDTWRMTSDDIHAWLAEQTMHPVGFRK
jgi:hypothetical protein